MSIYQGTQKQSPQLKGTIYSRLHLLFQDAHPYSGPGLMSLSIKKAHASLTYLFKKKFDLMKHSYKGKNYWKSWCSFVGNDVLSTRQSWADRKGRQTHTAVELSLNTSAWMTEWTLNSDCLSPHPDTLLLGWWAKLLRLFHMWDGITVDFLIQGGLNGVILGKPQIPKAVTDSSSSWQHCYLSSGCFLHLPLPSGQSKLRWQSLLGAPRSSSRWHTQLTQTGVLFVSYSPNRNR